MFRNWINFEAMCLSITGFLALPLTIVSTPYAPRKLGPEWRMADLSEDQAAALEATAADHTHTPDPTVLMGAR